MADENTLYEAGRFEPFPNEEFGRPVKLNKVINPGDLLIIWLSRDGGGDIVTPGIHIPGKDLIERKRVALRMRENTTEPEILCSYTQGEGIIRIWADKANASLIPWGLHKIEIQQDPGVSEHAWNEAYSYVGGDTVGYEDGLWYYTGHRDGQDQASEAGVPPNHSGSGWLELTPAPLDVDFHQTSHRQLSSAARDIAIVGKDIYILQADGRSIRHIAEDGAENVINLTLNPGANATTLAATDKWFFMNINPHAQRRQDGQYLAVYDHAGNHQQFPASAFGFGSLINADVVPDGTPADHAQIGSFIRALITSGDVAGDATKIFWHSTSTPVIGSADAASHLTADQLADSEDATAISIQYVPSTRKLSLLATYAGTDATLRERLQLHGGCTLWLVFEDSNGDVVMRQMLQDWISESGGTEDTKTMATWTLPNSLSGNDIHDLLDGLVENDKFMFLISLAGSNPDGYPPSLASSQGRVALPHGYYEAGDIDEENNYEDSVIHLLHLNAADERTLSVIRVFFNEASGAFQLRPNGTILNGAGHVQTDNSFRDYYAGPLQLLNHDNAIAAGNPRAISVHDGILRLYSPDGEFRAFDATYADVDTDTAGHDPRDPDHDGSVNLGNVDTAAVNDFREVFTSNSGEDLFIFEPVGDRVAVDESTNLAGDGSEENKIRNTAPLRPGYEIAQKFRGTFSNKGDRYVNEQYDGSDGHTSCVMTENYFGANQLGAFTNRDVRYGDHRWRLDNNPGVALYSSHGKHWLRIAFTPLTDGAPAPYAIKVGGVEYKFADATSEVNVYNWEVTHWDGAAVSLDDVASTDWEIEVLIEPGDYLDHVDNEIKRLAGQIIQYTHDKFDPADIYETKTQDEVYPDDDASATNFNTRRNLEDGPNTAARPESPNGRKFIFNPTPIFTNTDLRLIFQEGARGDVDAQRGEFANATPDAIANLLANSVFKFPIDCYAKIEVKVAVEKVRADYANRTVHPLQIFKVQKNTDDVVVYAGATRSTARQSQVPVNEFIQVFHNAGEPIIKVSKDDLFYITWGFQGIGGNFNPETDWKMRASIINITLLN